MSLSSIRDRCTRGMMAGASEGVAGVLKQDVVWRADASPVVVIDHVIVARVPGY